VDYIHAASCGRTMNTFFLANLNDEYVWLHQYHRRAQGVVTKEEFPINNIWSISLDIATMDGRGVAPLSEFTNHKVVTKSMVRFPGIGLARRRHTLQYYIPSLENCRNSVSVVLCELMRVKHLSCKHY
jgi:hypothetical protein